MPVHVAEGRKSPRREGWQDVVLTIRRAVREGGVGWRARRRRRRRRVY